MDFKDDASIDPFPHYARLRDSCPVPRLVKGSGLRPFLVTRYADAKAALNDPRLLKDPRHGEGELTAAGLAHIYFGEGATLSNNMLILDPPDHTRLRKLMAGQFTAHRTAQLAPRIQQLSDSLIDEMGPAGQAEFMSSFAIPLPALVIAELLGVPTADRQQFRTWAQGSLLPMHDPKHLQALKALSAYVAEIAERKKAEPGPDLISALIEDHSDNRLTEAELLGNIKLLILAGHETTTNLLGNGLLALLRNRPQLESLRAHPDLIPDAVEELLRYDSPVERATIRFAAEDVQIGDTLIPRGSTVYVALGSANRDEAEFPEADHLDIARSARGHLAFGYGLHFCLGAPLARLEAKIAFATLLRRLDDLELDAAPEDLTHQPSFMMRGLTTLPIRFRAKNPAEMITRVQTP